MVSGRRTRDASNAFADNSVASCIRHPARIRDETALHGRRAGTPRLDESGQHGMYSQLINNYCARHDSWL
jgi:hypothetical protein